MTTANPVQQEHVHGLVEAVGVRDASALIAVVGGGGKSHLLFALGRALPGRTVLTTTTRIFAAQRDLAPAWFSTEDGDIGARLSADDKTLLIIGGIEGERAVGVSPELPQEWLRRGDVDFVVVEADGSRMLPVKAPAEHEPVLPLGTDHLVIVVGIDAFEGSIQSVAHRPERVARLAGLDAARALTPVGLARVLASSDGGRKNAPVGAPVTILVNKVETPAELDRARALAAALLDESDVDRVAMGALQAGPDSEWEVWRR